MNLAASVSAARRDELIETIATRLCGARLETPAVLLLTMHMPLAGLGSALLLAAQPFVGVLTGDAFARDLALLLEEPADVERLIRRLEAR